MGITIITIIDSLQLYMLPALEIQLPWILCILAQVARNMAMIKVRKVASGGPMAWDHPGKDGPSINTPLCSPMPLSQTKARGICDLTGHAQWEDFYEY